MIENVDRLIRKLTPIDNLIRILDTKLLPQAKAYAACPPYGHNVCQVLNNHNCSGSWCDYDTCQMYKNIGSIYRYAAPSFHPCPGLAAQCSTCNATIIGGCSPC